MYNRAFLGNLTRDFKTRLPTLKGGVDSYRTDDNAKNLFYVGEL